MKWLTNQNHWPKKIIKKIRRFKGYWTYKDFADKEIDKKLFEQIFVNTLETLANKLINTTNKEENQIIVKNIEKRKDKLLDMDDFGDWAIQPNSQSIDLLNTIKLILNFNEDQLDLVEKI